MKPIPNLLTSLGFQSLDARHQHARGGQGPSDARAGVLRARDGCHRRRICRPLRLAGLSPGQRNHAGHAGRAHAAVAAACPAAATPQRDRRERKFNFDQRLYGLQANAHKGFATGSVQHDLSYGLELSRTETRQKRDGLQDLPRHRRDDPGRARPMCFRSGLPDQRNHHRRAVPAGRDRFCRRRLPPDPGATHRPLQAEAGSRQHLRRGQSRRGGQRDQRDQRIAEARRSLAFRRGLVAVRRLFARLPRAAVQRRQHRLHQPAVLLYRYRQSRPEA